METEKSKGERIVEMLCDGKTPKEIRETLGITNHYFEERLKPFRYGAGLPYEKRTYKARKTDILENVSKWKAHKLKLAEIEAEYRASLVHFDL